MAQINCVNCGLGGIRYVSCDLRLDSIWGNKFDVYAWVSPIWQNIALDDNDVMLGVHYFSYERETNSSRWIPFTKSNVMWLLDVELAVVWNALTLVWRNYNV